MTGQLMRVLTANLQMRMTENRMTYNIDGRDLTHALRDDDSLFTK